MNHKLKTIFIFTFSILLFALGDVYAANWYVDKDANGTKKYKTYVRVSIPKDTVNENLVNQIKKEEALYNSFKASQAFKELEHELNQ